MKCVLITLSAVLLTVACGDDKGGGDESPSAPSVSLVALLRSVPDTAENREQVLYYSNLSRARAGERPSSFDDDVTLLMDRSASSLFLPAVVRATVLDPEFAEFAGFDTRAIEVTFEFGAPPESVAVFVGTMNSDDIDNGLTASPGGDQLAKEDDGDVTYFSLGEDDRNELENVSAIRRIGEPLRMALAGDTLYWSRSRSAIDAALAGSAGDAKSLADDANYLAVARSLDTAEVVNAIVVPPSAGETWLVAGLGETFQGAASTVTIALQHADAAAAAGGAKAFRAHVEQDESVVTEAPWAETLTVVDVHAEGPLMLATLTSTNPGISVDVVLRRDNLLQF